MSSATGSGSNEVLFDQALTRLKEQGCALLVCGEAPRATYQHLARRMHGNPTADRIRLQVLTGEKRASDRGDWLPGSISPDDPTVEMFDFRPDNRSVTATAHAEDTVVSPMVAGPAFPEVNEEITTVDDDELKEENRGDREGLSAVDEDQFWTTVARPVPGMRGKRPPQVKPAGVDPDPSAKELQSVRELKSDLLAAIDESQQFLEGPGKLRLGISSIAPIVRTIGEHRTEELITPLRERMQTYRGMMFCQFPHSVTSPEATYLRDFFDCVVIVRRGLLKAQPCAFTRYVILEQSGVVDQRLASRWIPSGNYAISDNLRSKPCQSRS